MLYTDPFAALLEEAADPDLPLDAVSRPLWRAMHLGDPGLPKVARLRDTGYELLQLWELLVPQPKLSLALHAQGARSVVKLDEGTLVTTQDRWLNFEQSGGSRETRATLQPHYHNHWPEAFRFLQATYARIRKNPRVYTLRRELLDTAGPLKEARTPLIELLREQTDRPLKELQHRLTRQLSRQHQLMPLRRIQEIDAYCIRHLTRQSGLTISEKAGSRQELMGVERIVSFDSWENRFLKAFIELLTEECENRLAAPESRDDEGTRNRIRRFKGTLEAILSTPELQSVRQLTMSKVRLNNVLQKRPDYRRIYLAFRYLQKQKRLISNLWPYRPELLADYLFWHLAAALAHLEGARLAPDLPRPTEFPVRGSYLPDASMTIAIATSRYAWKIELQRRASGQLADVLLTMERHALTAPLNERPETYQMPCWVFWGHPGPDVLERAYRYVSESAQEGVLFILSENGDLPLDSRPPLWVIHFRYGGGKVHDEVNALEVQKTLATLLVNWLENHDAA